MKVQTQLFLNNALLLALLIAVAATTYTSVQSLIGTANWVSHTHEVMTNTRLLSKFMVDMETGQRGFLLTGNDTFLEPYRDGKKGFEETIQMTIRLVSDNPPQIQRLQKAKQLHDLWRRSAGEPEIALRRRVDRGEIPHIALSHVLQGRTETGQTNPQDQKTGKQILDETRLVIDEIVAIEEGLLANREQDNDAAARLSQNVALFGSLFAIFLAVWLGVYLVRQLTRQLGAEPHELLAISEKVSNGILSDRLSVQMDLGQQNVATAINRMIEMFQNAASQANTISQGDYTVNVSPRSDKDELGMALQDMTQALRTAASQADAIAQGDYQAAVSPRSDKDKLGIALFEMTRTLRGVRDIAASVAEGDFSKRVESKGERDLLGNAVNRMIENLVLSDEQNRRENWLKDGQAELAESMRGELGIADLVDRSLSTLASYLGAQVGVFYVAEINSDQLNLSGTYAYDRRGRHNATIVVGQGILGQAVKEKKSFIVEQVPKDHISVETGLGDSAPRNIVVVPLLYEGGVKGVLELGTFKPFSDDQHQLLKLISDSLAIALNTAQERERLAAVLEKSQSMTEELQGQQEELQQSNEELEEKALQMTTQAEELEVKNLQVEEAKLALEDKADQLALTSKYKSEFLANMSHELRTPLNSLLILSQQLADNADGNLTPKQVEFAQTIRSSGNDLLGLINEVLDLAKIESGTMDIDVEDVPLGGLCDFVQRSFGQLAKEKSLNFSVELDPNLPLLVETDLQRLQQVLRNLLSNALKFTEHGSVTLHMHPVDNGWSLGHKTLSQAESVIAFTVTDTGIGIAEDRQKLIFEAFQQAEGGTSRKYGGTGLGLSISREITALLAGEIVVQSTPGDGSRFTLFLPQAYPAGHNKRFVEDTAARLESHSMNQQRPSQNSIAPTPNVEGKELLVAAMPDDRDEINPGDRVILIIEDDERFAKILCDQAREKGFKALAALGGNAGFALAKSFIPDAITLDLRLPDVHGWVILDRLKHDPATRHIPVHVMSAVEEEQRSLQYGAISYLKKPVGLPVLDDTLNQIASFIERSVRRLLVVEDDKVQRKAIVELIGNNDVETVAVDSGEQALEKLKSQKFDCMVVDLKLPGMSGFDLINQVKKDSALKRIPIVVYTGKELTQKQESELRTLTETVIVKDAKSPERLLDETALFLHRVEANLPEPKRLMLKKLYQSDPTLAGKRVLIVDDDIRNIFATTSLLERHKMQVFNAENGKEGIEMLASTADIDIVLMDIMMPEMDGYQAMREIRKQAKFATLPILALTAKAMSGDRAKCIDAGASDYITKPIDSEQLLSLIRVWLYR